MSLTKFLNLNKWGGSNRFNLLRNFSIVSLSAFILTTALLSLFYQQQKVRDVIVLTEEKNVAIAQFFSNVFQQRYGSLLSSHQALSNEELAEDPRIRQLHEEILLEFEGLSIAKLKIFDLQGRTVFSTNASEIGVNKSRYPGFVSASSGDVVSQLEHRDTFNALRENLNDRHLLSSYVPIRIKGSNDEIIGVLELYTDVTPLLQRIYQTQLDVLKGSALILSLLYLLLFLFVQRADHLLKKQYEQLQESEDRYRQQANQLENVVLELKKAQSHMLQSEKMSSLGQLVAGVAHEINNPVTFIHGNLLHVKHYAHDLIELMQLYQKHYPHPVPEIQEAVDDIDLEFIQNDLPKSLSSMEIGSDRIREIILALRIFSRLNEAKIKPVDIHDGLESTLMILQHRLKAGPKRPEILVIKDYSTLPSIECYAGLLNQVFMNILANAIDALDQDASRRTYAECLEQPGQITLRTSLIDHQWVQIAIADNGSGMSSDVQQRMFDPFFTTKPVGKGTGMGMSISYQIVTERHGGQLECFSVPGKGTEFFIRIPLRQTVRDRTSSNAEERSEVLETI